MNEKIFEKLKDADFFKEIVTMDDVEKVKEKFKKENIDVNDEDLSGIRDIIKISLEMSSKLSDDELKQISAGYNDGIVDGLSENLKNWAIYRDTAVGGDDQKWNTNRYEWLNDNSDKVVELGLAAVLIGGTIGVQKLIKTGKEKGWWTKDYWIKKK